MSKQECAEDVIALLTGEIATLLQEKSNILVALDGRCAAGKTTLAAALKKQLSCEVVHMDDFFLRPHQRTPERLTVPGGNVDYERVLEEIIIPWKMQRCCVYRPYDCKGQTFGEPVKISPSPILLVEGAYACHPTLWEHYDLHVFLDVDGEEQRARILRRNGEAAAKTFSERWIPLEERYFAAYQIPQRCEVLYSARMTPQPILSPESPAG